MCQAYEGEAAYVRASEAFQREMQHKQQGMLARQRGEPRQDWEKLVYSVRHDVPDDAGTMHTPAWWRQHWFDGPLILAWLAGWDDEDRRIAAGGRPLEVDEREQLTADIDFLERAASEVRSGGRLQKARLRGDDMTRLMKLCGEADHQRYAMGTWEFDRTAGLSWIEEARQCIERDLMPHLAPALAAGRRRASGACAS